MQLQQLSADSKYYFIYAPTHFSPTWIILSESWDIVSSINISVGVFEMYGFLFIVLLSELVLRTHC